jgi:3D-(3,5/4)-trihydroxycyclohexane-1,2-dione acylhydrolase (decyclizing)
VININADLNDTIHYAHTTALVGDIGAVLDRLLGELGRRPVPMPEGRQTFLALCLARKYEWTRFKAARFVGKLASQSLSI